MSFKVQISMSNKRDQPINKQLDCRLQINDKINFLPFPFEMQSYDIPHLSQSSIFKILIEYDKQFVGNINIKMPSFDEEVEQKINKEYQFFLPNDSLKRSIKGCINVTVKNLQLKKQNKSIQKLTSPPQNINQKFVSFQQNCRDRTMSFNKLFQSTVMKTEQANQIDSNVQEKQEKNNQSNTQQMVHQKSMSSLQKISRKNSYSNYTARASVANYYPQKIENSIRTSAFSHTPQKIQNKYQSSSEQKNYYQSPVKAQDEIQQQIVFDMEGKLAQTNNELGRQKNDFELLLLEHEDNQQQCQFHKQKIENAKKCNFISFEHEQSLEQKIQSMENITINQENKIIKNLQKQINDLDNQLIQKDKLIQKQNSELSQLNLSLKQLNDILYEKNQYEAKIIYIEQEKNQKNILELQIQVEQEKNQKNILELTDLVDKLSEINQQYVTDIKQQSTEIKTLNEKLNYKNQKKIFIPPQLCEKQIQTEQIVIKQEQEEQKIVQYLQQYLQNYRSMKNILQNQSKYNPDASDPLDLILAVQFLDSKEKYTQIRHMIERLEQNQYKIGNIQFEVFNQNYDLFVKYEEKVCKFDEFIQQIGVQELDNRNLIEKQIENYLANHNSTTIQEQGSPLKSPSKIITNQYKENNNYKIDKQIFQKQNPLKNKNVYVDKSTQ